MLLSQNITDSKCENTAQSSHVEDLLQNLSIIYLQVEHFNSPIAPGKDGIGKAQQIVNLIENKNANLH